MDIEFHYYITGLIAAKAGFPPDQATIIAHSSQYVDDNDIRYEIDKGKASSYRNYISQTMNILKPKAKLLRIYPIFHFIPGDPKAKTAWRKDGKLHWLNTTPNSSNANGIMDKALESDDIYRIGIAAHGYVDTWAHQNFVGYYADFNALAGPLESATPNIGHADARHHPDWPGLVWRDQRLIEERVDNKARFLAASIHLLEKLARFVDNKMDAKELGIRKKALTRDLKKAIGETDQSNSWAGERTAKYIELSESEAYGSSRLVKYDPEQWFDDVVNEQVRGLRDRSDSLLTRFDPASDIYTWRNSKKRKQSDWYKFQEAVKSHQSETWEILEASNLKGLQLEAL